MVIFRQCDPISLYICLLCSKTLAVINMLKAYKWGKRNLLSQYADDISLMSDDSKQSLEQALLVVKFYAYISCLGVNVDKTSMIRRTIVCFEP